MFLELLRLIIFISSTFGSLPFGCSNRFRFRTQGLFFWKVMLLFMISLLTFVFNKVFPVFLNLLPDWRMFLFNIRISLVVFIFWSSFFMNLMFILVFCMVFYFWCRLILLILLILIMVVLCCVSISEFRYFFLLNIFGLVRLGWITIIFLLWLFCSLFGPSHDFLVLKKLFSCKLLKLFLLPFFLQFFFLILSHFVSFFNLFLLLILSVHYFILLFS